MDFLLEPNIAYLILLVGALLTLMAIVTPGTGMFEVGAAFCLLLAGYAVYHLSFNWWAMVILGLSIVPFVYSVDKPGREPFLGLAILLLVFGSVFLFAGAAGRSAVNPVVAIFASVMAAGYLWISIQKSQLAAHAPPVHDLKGLIGQVGEAKTAIQEDGSVQIAGELWSARSEAPIPAGSQVRAVRREGFVLIVEKK